MKKILIVTMMLLKLQAYANQVEVTRYNLINRENHCVLTENIGKSYTGMKFFTDCNLPKEKWVQAGFILFDRFTEKFDMGQGMYSETICREITFKMTESKLKITHYCISTPQVFNFVKDEADNNSEELKKMVADPEAHIITVKMDRRAPGENFHSSKNSYYNGENKYSFFCNDGFYGSVMYEYKKDRSYEGYNLDDGECPKILREIEKAVNEHREYILSLSCQPPKSYEFGSTICKLNLIH